MSNYNTDGGSSDVEYKEENIIEEDSATAVCDEKGCTPKKRVRFDIDSAAEKSRAGGAAAEKDVDFWSENPNIILSSKYVLELFPTENMTLNQKLNAITRLILLFALFGFIYTKSIRILIIAGIILFCIFLLYLYKKRNESGDESSTKEGYVNPAEDLYTPDDSTKFLAPSITNPFSNVLITDYEDNPQKKPAPPTDDAKVNISLLEKAKDMVIQSNPGQPDIADKLFSDLGDNYNFEQSLRQFYSTANTEIPNDQQAFAEFCYGSMISCKEGNKFACARNLPRYANY